MISLRILTFQGKKIKGQNISTKNSMQKCFMASVLQVPYSPHNESAEWIRQEAPHRHSYIASAASLYKASLRYLCMTVPWGTNRQKLLASPEHKNCICPKSLYKTPCPCVLVLGLGQPHSSQYMWTESLDKNKFTKKMKFWQKLCECW